MTNLLANGGFDGAAWRKTHDGTEYNEIEVPESWTCFWKEGGAVPHDPENEQGYRRPECKVIEPQPPYLDPPRVRNGAGAWQVFTLWGIHDAGLYQRVAAPAGSTVRATAYTHAWSAQGDKVAEGSIQDDNFTQLVGIDPTGGTDPWAPSVIWGPAQHLYDTYGRVLSTDATVGSGGIVTVFLREVVKWRYKHCDGYWDDVTLEVVGSGGGDGDDDDDDGNGTGGTVKLHEDTLTRIEAALNGIRDAVREVGGEIVERLAALAVPDDGHEDDEDDEPPTTTLPCTATGSKIGAHCIEAGSVPAMVRDVVSRGARIAVVKAVDGWGTLAEIKRDSPDTITIGRVTHPLEGCPDVADSETSLMVLAERIMSYTFNKINCTPEAQGLIDYYEPVNEPDPAGVAGYARLGELMLYCMDIAELSGIHLALLSLNCGTPEWDEMQALIASGMFQRARAGGHVIALHEGTLPDLDGHTGWTAPIDLWWGEGHAIPGAPDVDRAGALCFRYRYLQQLMAEAGCEVPIVITEFYTGYDLPGYAPIAGIEWYDNEAARDPLLLGFCPFTFGPTGSWKDQSCETYAAALVERIVALKDRVNGAPVEPEPEPEPPDNTLSIIDLRGALMTNPASPWYPWARRTLSEITTLFVHHSAGMCSSDPQFVENIAAYHCAATGKNRPGICYAYVVGADGTVWQTSDLENVVFGQGSADSPGDENRYGVSVCLLGCFINGAEPTAAQLDSLERLITHIEGLVGKSLRVWGHKDVINTQCPGDSWPFRPGWGLVTTPLIGLHDEGLTQTGTEWLMALHKPALVVKPVYVRNYENGALDYSAAEAAGLRVLVSLRWSWSVDKGGAGTLPPRDTNEWNCFIAGAIQLIKSARGVWGWSIGNEVNNPREFPAWRDLTAADAAAAFNALAVACPGVRLAPAPLDPFNAQAGDPRDWLAGLWGALEHAPAFVDAHGYIHGPDRTLVGSDVKFTDAPLEWQYYNYPGCVTSLLHCLPTKYVNLPVYITEFNHIVRADGSLGWEDSQVTEDIIADAVEVAGQCRFAGLAIYRWRGDEWAVVGNQHVRRAIAKAIGAA